MPIHFVLSRASERRRSDLQDVHFHRGPQGQPVPCYDTGCQIPQMASDDVRDAAHATKS